MGIKGEEEHGDAQVAGPLSDYTHLQESVDAILKKARNLPDLPIRDVNLRSKYGSAMIAVMQKGKGEVFNAGTTSWINGLRGGDFFTQQITRNVLNLYSGSKPAR